MADSTAVVVEGAASPTSDGPRDTAAIRSAYEARDPNQSRAAHDAGGKIVAGAEKHLSGGGYLKSVVYGAMDGIQTTFSVVSGAAGGGLGVAVVLILGFSNLLADGLSMGICDAMSESAELNYIKAEREREAWEFENYREGELKEMVELYEQQGFSKDDASEVVSILSKYDKLFVDLMMEQELDLKVPSGDEAPWKNGVVTFLSFAGFGLAPLLAYICFAWGLGLSNDALFGIAIAVTAVSMFALGAIKSKLTGQTWWGAGLETVVIGGLTAAASYGIAFAVQAIIGEQGCGAA